ncbi:hypothetical protein CASFOL_015742 [Castilleja foliolosa]|uniref:Mitochondrial transcription termination factor family protein n=1 Tax=Castilleja foliolosa TaxID=1961234 RepID=A0ABD3DI31_9LAMI
MSPFVRRRLLTCLLFPKNHSSFLCKKALIHFSLNFSTTAEKNPAKASTVYDFLIHKHNFSHESATRIASVLTRLKNPERSDSTLAFFRASGFSIAQLEKILTYRPSYISSDLEKVIKPKLKVFRDFGFSADETADIISKAPCILHCSVDNKLIPSFAVLEGLLGSKSEVVKLHRVRCFLVYDLKKTLVPNFEFLKSCGVNVDQIIRFIRIFPRLFLQKPEIMENLVKKVDSMGVKRSSGMFIHAVRVVGSMNKESWETKLRNFRDLGFSENDILRVFRSTPLVFSASKEKVMKITKVLVGTGKYDMGCILNSPNSLLFSVENRYMPRLRVLGVLERRGLIKEWPSLGTLHLLSDGKFYLKYVAPYLDDGELIVAWGPILSKSRMKEKKNKELSCFSP